MDDCVAQLTITGRSALQPGVRVRKATPTTRDNEIVTFHELRIQQGLWAACDFSRSNLNGVISDIIVTHIYLCTRYVAGLIPIGKSRANSDLENFLNLRINQLISIQLHAMEHKLEASASSLFPPIDLAIIDHFRLIEPPLGSESRTLGPEREVRNSIGPMKNILFRAICAHRARAELSPLNNSVSRAT